MRELATRDDHQQRCQIGYSMKWLAIGVWVAVWFVVHSFVFAPVLARGADIGGLLVATIAAADAALFGFGLRVILRRFRTQNAPDDGLGKPSTVKLIVGGLVAVAGIAAAGVYWTQQTEKLPTTSAANRPLLRVAEASQPDQNQRVSPAESVCAPFEEAINRSLISTSMLNAEGYLDANAAETTARLLKVSNELVTVSLNLNLLDRHKCPPPTAAIKTSAYGLQAMRCESASKAKLADMSACDTSKWSR